MLGLFENQDRGRLDRELSALGDRVDALVELAKAEVKEVSIEWDAGKASAGPSAVHPEPALRSQKYDTEWFLRVQARVQGLSDEIALAEQKEESRPRHRWNEKAYGPPPQRGTGNCPNEPISAQARLSNVA